MSEGTTHVTFLSGSDCTLENCATVSDVQVRLCMINTSWLPSEVHVLDGQTLLQRESAPPPRISVLWREGDRLSPAIYVDALHAFAKFGDSVGAIRCATKILSKFDADFIRSEFCWNQTCCEAQKAYIEAGIDKGLFNDALYSRAFQGSVEQVELLLAAKADPSALSRCENVFVGARKIVFSLLAGLKGHEETPLHRSSFNGELDIVRALLNGRADFNLTDSRGQTPLLVSSRRGRLDVVQTLLDEKADTSIADNKGRTPLSVSSESGHTDIAQALMKMANSTKASMKKSAKKNALKATTGKKKTVAKKASAKRKNRMTLANRRSRRIRRTTLQAEGER